MRRDTAIAYCALRGPWREAKVPKANWTNNARAHGTP